MHHVSRTAVLLASLLSLALALPGTGCRGRVGQLLNNDPLAAQGFDEGPQVTRTPGVDWTAYRSVFVQPVSMDADATQGRDVDDADVAALPGKFRDDLQKAFDGKFTRAQAPAAGAIVVDARIIRAVPNLPLRNIAPQSQVGRTGYGYAVAVITLRDGASGQVLASARESRATSRFGLEKMSEWGSVEKSFEEWAAGAVKLAE